MLILKAPFSYEEEIKKSRFIVHAAPIADAQAALDFVAEKSDPTATHNCWAYRLADGQYRFNDDGEPGGTAGRPILQAIEGQELQDVVVLVVRFFGGIKLGAGGLVRAYGGCAAKCLQQAPTAVFVPRVAVRCFCSFADFERFKSRLDEWGVRQGGVDFDAQGAWMELHIPLEQVGEVQVWHETVTRAQGDWAAIEDETA